MENKKSIAYTLKHSDCCGCKLCADVCPKGSISYNLDDEGFYVPMVDETTCINCGICSRKCPELNLKLEPEASVAISAYSKRKDLYLKGSSGGVFANLAIKVLEEGGKVYGAAFDDNMILRHVGIDKFEELYPLCKSKYLQSCCGGVYRNVLDDLRSGKSVLFCGTPCQCQALANATNENLRNKLLLVDFVCHGVSNQELFNENLSRYCKRYKGGVLNYTFRNKEKARYHHSFKIGVIIPPNKKKYIIGTYYEDPYYYGYEKRFILRKSCYSCRWASTRRCSDITLSDFFGVKVLNPTIKEDYVSCIFCNTSRGREAFNSIKDDLAGIEKYKVEDAAKNNECLRHPMKLPANREEFFKSWKAEGFEYVVTAYLTPKHKFVYDIFYGMPITLRNRIRQVIRNVFRIFSKHS